MVDYKTPGLFPNIPRVVFLLSVSLFPRAREAVFARGETENRRKNPGREKAIEFLYLFLFICCSSRLFPRERREKEKGSSSKRKIRKREGKGILWPRPSGFIFRSFFYIFFLYLFLFSFIFSGEYWGAINEKEKEG